MQQNVLQKIDRNYCISCQLRATHVVCSGEGGGGCLLPCSRVQPTAVAAAHSGNRPAAGCASAWLARRQRMRAAAAIVAARGVGGVPGLCARAPDARGPHVGLDLARARLAASACQLPKTPAGWSWAST
jgi:hypothetical protein